MRYSRGEWRGLENDLISRQAAIDAVRHEFNRVPTIAIRAMEVVRSLPSAQQESHDKCTEIHACDLISRQRAIDAFDCTNELIVGGEANAQNVVNYINKVVGKIETLPSARPEIIHCKDCKWKNRYNCTRAVEVLIDDDKYCAWAERREDG